MSSRPIGVSYDTIFSKTPVFLDRVDQTSGQNVFNPKFPTIGAVAYRIARESKR